MKPSLYHNAMSSCSQKVRLALNEKGVEFESIEVQLHLGEQYKPEYLKLNPNGLVPTLVNGNDIVIESAIINEYIDDAFDGTPLRPEKPGDRAVMRLWSKHVDDIQPATFIFTFGIAFRHTLLQRTREKLDDYYAKINNPDRLALYKDLITNGINSQRFKPSVLAFDKLLINMEKTLEKRTWLAGETFTLADIALIPYLTRLEHLNLSQWWQDKPGLSNWFDRCKARESYRTAVSDWFVLPGIELMKEKGREVRPEIMKITNSQSEGNSS